VEEWEQSRPLTQSRVVVGWLYVLSIIIVVTRCKDCNDDATDDVMMNATSDMMRVLRRMNE